MARASGPIRVLSIGHSYAIALNRATIRTLAADSRFDVVLAAPKVLDGDLRRVRLEPEPKTSPLAVIGIDATFTRYHALLEYDAARLRRLVASRDFDVVYAWVEPWTLAARQIVAALERSTAQFCFWTAQNLAADYPEPFRDIERQVVARADRWLAAEELVLHTQIARGYPADSGAVLYLGVDTSLFTPGTSGARQAVLRELGLRPPVIGFLGRLVEEKGLDVAMAALERLDRSLRWSLLVMGSGPYEPAIRAWARRRCCSKRVKIRLVRHERVPRYLAAVDLLLVPSQTRAHWREQFGRAVVEAFAAGVPAIVSDSGALPRTAGDAARLVSEADAGAWAAAIADLLGDASARAELSRRGRQRAQRFSTTAVAGELAAVFTAMSASRTRRRPRQLRA